MENESSVITIAKSAKYESDKSTFTERCTFFDIGWYVVSAAASIWKLQVTSQSNFSDSIVFIVLFVTPVCVKHVLAFDIYKGMRSSVDSTIFFNFINHLSNYILFISFFILVLLALVSNTIVYNDSIKLIFLIIHIFIGFIGIYDRITVRINPNFEERKEDE